MLKSKFFSREDHTLSKIQADYDKNGLTLLHYATDVGSTDIFKTLIKTCPQIPLYDAAQSVTVLHVACQNKRYDMCAFLLSDDKYKHLLPKKSSHGCSAAHFTAVGGSIQILKLLESKKLDITTVTNNGLNVIDIVCIFNHTAMCTDLIKRSHQKQLSISLDKSDARGWTIAHFAAMVGNKDILKLLIDHKVMHSKTHNKNTILHICCEYGHDAALCYEILEMHNILLHDVNAFGWNALHFVAKGGNLNVFKGIEKALDQNTTLDNLCKETDDGETVLPICCIHKSVNICKYICDKLKVEAKHINKRTKRMWTAAHCVAVEIKQDGSEKELIRILVKAGIDIKSATDDRCTVLTVACEHRNYRLVDFLLDNYQELLEIETLTLEKVAEETKDEKIESTILNAIKKRKQPIAKN